MKFEFGVTPTFAASLFFESVFFRFDFNHLKKRPNNEFKLVFPVMKVEKSRDPKPSTEADSTINAALLKHSVGTRFEQKD